MVHWKLLLLLLLLSTVSYVSTSYHPEQRYSTYLLIDCGASNETAVTDDDLISISWLTDEEFIKTGQNYLLTYSQTFNTMNSLRYFPSGLKNCYYLPFYANDHKFLFRAGFYYGNYDGLSKPPSFNLEIDGNLWAKVTTSMSEDEAVYHEIIYKTKGDSAEVCLVRTSDHEVPFISSPEATFMMESFCRLMEKNTALSLHSRINYGANKSIDKLIDHFEECCNRKWESKEMSEYLNIKASFIPDGSLLDENGPPWPVMATAIQAKNVSDSIYLTVDFAPQTGVVAYFVLYFMDAILRFPPNQTSKVEIYVDSKKLNATDVPALGRYPNVYHVVSLYPVQVNFSANITISPAEGSTLAPVLNAMEVFSVFQVSKGGYVLNCSMVLCVIFLHLLAIIVTGN